MPLGFRQGDNAPPGRIHGKSEFAVFCPELFQQGVCLRNSGSVQLRHLRQCLQTADLVSILRSGNLDGKLPEIRGNAVESDDLARCPVDRHTEVSVFLGEYSDQRLSLVLLIHIQ